MDDNNNGSIDSSNEHIDIPSEKVDDFFAVDGQCKTEETYTDSQPSEKPVMSETAEQPLIVPNAAEASAYDAPTHGSSFEDGQCKNVGDSPDCGVSAELEKKSEETDGQLSIASQISQESSTMHQTLGEIIDLLKSMSKDFQVKIAKSEKETLIIDQMHSELHEYKNDLYSHLTLLILKEIINMREHFLSLVSQYQQKPEGEQYIPLKTIESFIDVEMTDILVDNGIEIFSYEAGDSFDPRRQKVMDKVDTDRPELNKTIARVFGDGYAFKERTLSAQRVDIYLNKNKPSEEAPKMTKPEGEDKDNG